MVWGANRRGPYHQLYVKITDGSTILEISTTNAVAATCAPGAEGVRKTQSVQAFYVVATVFSI